MSTRLKQSHFGYPLGAYVIKISRLTREQKWNAAIIRLFSGTTENVSDNTISEICSEYTLNQMAWNVLVVYIK